MLVESSITFIRIAEPKMKQRKNFNAIPYPTGTTSTRKRTSATASSMVAVGTRASNRATRR